MNYRLIVLLSLLIIPGFGSAQESAQQKPLVRMQTSMGDIILELYPDKAPESVENFLSYVESGHYDGTIFHRVISTFMIQGGGFTADYKRKPTNSPITNEADNMLSNERGTIAMARTAHPHSATTQFFINVANNVALNHTGKTNSRAWGYAVFGRVVDGMDVVDAIRAVPTGPGGPFPKDAPEEPVVIEKAEVIDTLPAQSAAEEDTPATSDS